MHDTWTLLSHPLSFPSANYVTVIMQLSYSLLLLAPDGTFLISAGTGRVSSERLAAFVILRPSFEEQMETQKLIPGIVGASISFENLSFLCLLKQVILVV